MSNFLTVTKLTDEERKKVKEGTTTEAEAIEKIVKATIEKSNKEGDDND